MATSFRRIAFTTLGCKVNQSETDLLARQFAAAGYACVPFEEHADVYVVNTCTVTHVADKKSRQLLSQAHRNNPDALVVATGCYASIVGEGIAADHRLVVRNRDKPRLLTLVEGSLGRTVAELPSFSEEDKYLHVSGGEERTRAMVKVQDGCDAHCTYCIIPRARGRSKSTAPEEIVRRIHALVGEGHAEVVLTGVDLGSYGGDDPRFPDLGGLLLHVLHETDVQRIRVSSLEPGDFNPDWIPLWQNARLCPHIHVPLQSGSAEVLARMERKYTPAEFSTMVALCREGIPGVTLTTDVMVGFPGETRAEFDEGYRFIRGVSFDGMHVFKYSSRSGTRAARMAEQVSESTKNERSRVLREEASAGVERLRLRHIGGTGSVAWEGERDGVWRGLTGSNVRVYGYQQGVLPGRLSGVRLVSAFRDGIWAEPIDMELPLVPAS